MQRAYTKSDRTYDGVFFLGVKTTGVFCRPSCGARKPLPRNVEYFASPREALFAGYRPCKRCRPLTAAGEPPVWAQPLLTAVERDPERRIRDGEIRAMGIDPARARRYFQRTYGLTFQAYTRGRRLARSLEGIRSGARIDDVLIGYSSHSGFREAFQRTFGRPPGKARDARALTVGWIDTPLGPLLATATESTLVLLEFTDRRMLETQFAVVRRLFGLPIVPGDNAVIRRTREELQEYFAGKRRRFSVPLAYPGSDFQQRVWRELLRIPFGATRSYEDLARRIGARAAQRAVGTANGRNRIAIIIPCHRVINKDGGLGGYGGGIWRKQALLEIEQAALARPRRSPGGLVRTAQAV
jgi:AraC family transcriptional regulator of adaptative response/methylated-DNA-[protein]-cysteine methyltransferase